jgi:hypothetical protein
MDSEIPCILSHIMDQLRGDILAIITISYIRVQKTSGLLASDESFQLQVLDPDVKVLLVLVVL